MGACFRTEAWDVSILVRDCSVASASATPMRRPSPTSSPRANTTNSSGVLLQVFPTSRVCSWAAAAPGATNYSLQYWRCVSVNTLDGAVGVSLQSCNARGVASFNFYASPVCAASPPPQTWQFPTSSRCYDALFAGVNLPLGCAVPPTPSPSATPSAHPTHLASFTLEVYADGKCGGAPTANYTLDQEGCTLFPNYNAKAHWCDATASITIANGGTQCFQTPIQPMEVPTDGSCSRMIFTGWGMRIRGGCKGSWSPRPALSPMPTPSTPATVVQLQWFPQSRTCSRLDAGRTNVTLQQGQCVPITAQTGSMGVVLQSCQDGIARIQGFSSPLCSGTSYAWTFPSNATCVDTGFSSLNLPLWCSGQRPNATLTPMASVSPLPGLLISVHRDRSCRGPSVNYTLPPRVCSTIDGMGEWMEPWGHPVCV